MDTITIDGTTIILVSIALIALPTIVGLITKSVQCLIRMIMVVVAIAVIGGIVMMFM
jgi:hypothetical protein